MHLFVALSFCVSLVVAVPVSVNSNPEEAGFFEGDIELEPGEEPYHRNAVKNHKLLWPNGVVPYTIDAAHQKNARHVQHFHDAMNEIMNKTKVNGKKCIDFQPHNSSRGAYIQFSNGTGCHSSVGYHSKHKASVSLGNGCLRKGTIIHEILHSLGFWHEQSRSDRDGYVTIHWDNIQKGHQGNFMKHQKDNLNMPYDYRSVMHYGAFAFSINGDVMTIEPKQSGIRLGQRKGLTDMDAKKIQIVYGCIPRPNIGAVTTANPWGEHVTPQISNNTAPPVICTFDSGLCGWVQSTQDDMDWRTGQGITPSRNTGPNTDHSSYIGGIYLYLEASENTNKTGILVSPMYAGDTYCFSAWYNMYGRDMGSLFFAIIKGGHKHILMSTHGGHGGKWIHFQRQINIPSSKPFQFQIEGRIGRSYHSDIAIDDVSVTPGKCAHG